MPEHFHGIIWVRKRLASPLGEVIRSFKIAGSKANASLEAPCLFDDSPTFWFPGLYDTILFSKGQLKRMTAYILNNAKRRRAVMQNPDLFHTTRNMEIVPGKHGDSVGNHFLLEKPGKMLVQVSRRAGETETSPGIPFTGSSGVQVSRCADETEIAAVVEQALLHASRGGVVVSGCISPGEQAVARAVREAGLPLIAIIPRGFGPYFKPNGDYFDACERGNLLLISPFPKISRTERLTRERCFAINAIAAEICGEDPALIHYRGSRP